MREIIKVKKIQPVQKVGLVYPNGREATQAEVSRTVAVRSLADAETRIERLTRTPKSRDFEEWTDVMETRQAQRKEVLSIPERVEVKIHTKKPILVSLFGDVHAGGEDVDYKGFAEDVTLTRKAKGYSVVVGDLTDSIHFPSAQDNVANNTEQDLFMESAMDELAEGGRLIAGFIGDHDGWVKSRMGRQGIYHRFGERYNGAHYLEGVSYIDVGLNNGEKVVDYKMVGSHRHKGFSVYNDSHASLRQEKDEARGADISFTAHNHVKGHNQQVVKVHGGGEKIIHHVSLGAYKATDHYSRKMGWPRKGEVSRGGFGIILHPGEKEIEVHWTIKKAVDALAKLIGG